MALVFCRECGKQISDTAASCPGCGAPQASVISPLPVEETYKPVVPAREFNPSGFAFALLTVVGASYFVNRMVERQHNYRDAVPTLFWVVVGGSIALAGLYSLLTNSVRTPGKLTFCPKCQMNVVARGTGSLLGFWRCERCETRVKV